MPFLNARPFLQYISNFPRRRGGVRVRTHACGDRMALRFAIIHYGALLGHRNDEGIESGAWWFYYKLGFRPRSPRIRRLARRELRRIKTRPSHRSSKRTLQRLAEDYLYFETAKARAPFWPRIAELGAKTARHLAGLAAADQETALRLCLEKPGVYSSLRRPEPPRRFLPRGKTGHPSFRFCGTSSVGAGRSASI